MTVADAKPGAGLKDFFRAILPHRFWVQLRLAKTAAQVRSYKRRLVKHVYHGAPLTVELADPMSAGWYDHDWPSLEEINLLAAGKLKKGACVFDLGAHQCVVALILARLVESGQVVAVEANERNAQVGARNIQRNQAANCRVVHAAVADHNGTVWFNKGWNGQAADASGEWGRVEVKCRTIDDLAREYGAPDVLFIDVEGYEGHALRGAAATLAKRPDCYVEVHVEFLPAYGETAESIVSFFDPDEYKLFFRTSEDAPFELLHSLKDLPAQRFFLVALAREFRK